MSSVTTSLAAPVAQAIAELQAQFVTTFEAAGDGGAIVVVHELEIGPAWTHSTIDLAFQIAFNYPFAAIYPYYAQGGLARVDRVAEPALRQTVWREARHTQISLRAKRWSPQVDTAVGAVLQVQDWFRRR